MSQKDPWDIEHDALLQRAPNAVCHSDTIYTGLVHKGFNADSTAEGLIRRYPPFQETEQHRQFLVRSISERHIIPGEKDDYFTPAQLWEEDDRVNGKKEFTRDDASSSSGDTSEDEASDLANGQEAEQPVVLAAVPKGRIGEDQLESDEQRALLLSDPVDNEPKAENEGPSSDRKSQDVEMTDDDLAELFGEGPEPEHEPPVITITTPVAEGASKTGTRSKLPITLQSDDHTTTITHDYLDVQGLLDSLDLSSKATVTAITHIASDQSLVLAVLGRREVIGSEGSDRDHPIRVDDGAAGNSNADSQQLTTEQNVPVQEWNVVAQRPTVAFLSGPKSYNALLAEIRWDPDTIVATTASFNDGQALVLLVGEQPDQELSRNTASSEQTDPANQLDAFFASIRSHKSIPAEHAEIANLLEIVHSDMIEAGTLPAERLSNKELVNDAFQVVDDLDPNQQRGNLASPNRKNALLAGAQSYQPQHPRQQASGFPAAFDEFLNTSNRVAAPKAKPASSKKRARTPSDSDSEGSEDDTYISQPQRKRKVAGVSGRGGGRPRKTPRRPGSSTTWKKTAQ